MNIRAEQIEDFPKIYAFVKEAFQTAEVSNGKEQDFVLSLRASENYIPELALVALEQEEIIGHIMLTKTFIQNKKEKYPVLILAPLSVKQAYRNQGIGKQLIVTAEQQAIKAGYSYIALVGDPAYYSRFGYVETAKEQIFSNLDIPNAFILGKWLFSDQEGKPEGILRIPK